VARTPDPKDPRRSAQDAVREFLRARGCAASMVSAGLDGLVSSWERVAESVERGYPLDTLDDYLNDMDLRQLIADVLRAVPIPARGTLATRLGTADTRIRAALVPAERCLWGNAIASKRGWSATHEWWYFMRPIRPGAGLRSDLGLARE
jgi:hypothetical protein